MNFIGEIFFSLSSNSLFSTITTLYTLLLLYFPSLFLQFLFSPVVFSTLILLLYLLRLGAAQQSTRPRKNEPDPPDLVGPAQMPPQEIEELIDRDCKCNSPVSDTGSDLGPEYESGPNLFYADSFVEWDVRAPLEVIHEGYEGEEGDQNDAVSEAWRESEMNIIRRYASLSLFYPESDGDGSSSEESPGDGDWDSPENMCFRWEGEDDREGLIEIALDDEKGKFSEVDEENLIEIDLSPAR